MGHFWDWVLFMKRIATLGLLPLTFFASSWQAFANETPPGKLEAGSGPELPVQVIVSRKDQTLKVFRGQEMIATSRVSTGKRGHTTPTGIFSVLEKRRRHFSNLYNNAPMPYMQRLTWSGIALHESNSVPRYPASHGCVRLPRGFAKKLFGMTERGAHVVIAERETSPVQVSHANLFQPVSASSASDKMASLSDLGSAPQNGAFADLQQALDPQELVKIRKEQAKRQAILEAKERNLPIRIFVTRRAQTSLVKDIQILLNEQGFNAGDVDGLAGPDTFKAIKRFVEAKKGSIEERNYHWDGKISRDLLQALYYSGGKGDVPTGHIFVRQKFRPLFDAPIHIKDASKPLGAHLLTASHMLDDKQGTKLGWLSVSLGDKLHPRMQKNLGIDQDLDKSGLFEVASALDRIEIPQDIRDQIGELLIAGSSLAISDKGISRETTVRGTDFIVLTKPNLTKAKAKRLAKVKKYKKAIKHKKLAKKKKPQRKKVAQRRTFRLFSGRRTN